MGLSSFWTAIKRPRFSETESRKHVETIYNQHHKVSPTRYEGSEPPHHFDAIYDTHHHIPSGQNSGPKRHPSSPPRIHSPTSKQNKRQSLWKTPSVSRKPDEMVDVQRSKSEKRRSFWRTDSKTSTTAPAVREPEIVRSATDAKKSKRSSFWRQAPYPQEERLIPSDTGPTAADVQTRRANRRLSLHRSTSGKSTRNRLSWFGSRVDDSDDEDIPALPPMPVQHVKRPKSRSIDPGRHLGFGDVSVVQPGTAITTDDVHSTAAPSKRSSNSVKRQSLTRLITSNRKSISDNRELDQSGSKRKRSSWFSSKDGASRNSAIPPVPALPTGSSMPLGHIDPSEAAFHRFLHNMHNAHPQGAKTDYERFLNASRAYDDSIPTPQHLSHRNSSSNFHAPRPVSGIVPTALPTLKRSTYAAPSRKHASHCRPRSNGSKTPESPDRPFLTDEQQREWNKLREIMDDSPAQVSVAADDDDQYDDDGVIGMIRQLSREEAREAHVKAQARRCEYERGYWANEDALARLSGR